MRTYLDCIPCFCQQALDALRLVSEDESLHERVLRDVLRAVSEMDCRKSPAEMGGVIHRMIREATASSDPYAALKERSNAFALALYPELQQKVAASPDPLQTAVRLAIAGNIIDMGVKAGFREESVHRAIEHCLTAPLEGGGLDAFRDAVASANDILYLADNAGEIVFDRLLLGRLPTDKITVVVKGSPVINDATMADARAAGIAGEYRVIDNGSDMPGTVLEKCADDFRARFDAADVIISKGQGNFETLNDCDANIFFLFKVKCDGVSRHTGCDVGSIVLVRGEGSGTRGAKPSVVGASEADGTCGDG